jgi:hypothetical protein
MKTKQETIAFLNQLVHKRFSIENLNKKLSTFFGASIVVYNASQGRIDNGEDDDELSDYNLMKTHDNKNKTKRIWYDTRLRLWTLQDLDSQENQIGNVDYSIDRKNAFEWLKEESK